MKVGEESPGIARHLLRFAFRGVCQLASSLERFGLQLKRMLWGKTSAGTILIDILLFPSDLIKIRQGYRDVFRRYPRVLRPQTFNEWLQVSKLTRRKARYRQFADKLRVRDFVRKIVGDDVLTKVLWSGVDINEAATLCLPEKFVIKANNGSGMNMIITNVAVLNWQHARSKTSEWLAEDYSKHHAEWQYRWIKPAILIEQFLETPNGGIPFDYKFFCFHGRVELVQVDVDRFTNHTRAMLDRNFNLLPFQFQYPRPNTMIIRPTCFEQMIQIAEKLSQGEIFICVDLYDLGRPIYGELTLHPEAGTGRFTPAEWDRRLFELLRARAY